MRSFVLALFLLTPALAAGSTTVTGGGLTSSTSPVVVTANVDNSCTLTTTDATFGNYAATSSAPVTATATIEVLCNVGANYGLILSSDSAANDGRTSVLSKSGSTDELEYALTNVSNGDPLTGDTSFTSGGTTDTVTLTFQITPNQYAVTSGSYTDTQIVTIELPQ